jgi:hypothetical protein
LTAAGLARGYVLGKQYNGGTQAAPIGSPMSGILAKRTLSKPCSTIVEYVPRVAAQFRNLQAA